ncbi:MAG: reductive dehalogenase domain-containing protein [Bacteroidales bacterium]|nr:reductive dehalogenase domain-containing protein [Bacteroidales bacterium]
MKPTTPSRNIDEHDIVFSRMRLKPGTQDWDEYYSTHPEQSKTDTDLRQLPGLLSEKGAHFHVLNFPAADTNFLLIENLHPANKETSLDTSTDITSEDLTQYIKGWTKHLGVHSVGIAQLQDYHLYTLRGRGINKGKPVLRRHKYAVAFTVEMDHDNVMTAPLSPVILESSQQYLKSATIALQLSGFLNKLGYQSRAHIDGDYELICPLVARDAGLGEIGRMGLLMTPLLGPRVRIAVVTTNAPLLTDKYRPDPNLIEFCRICKKCAHCCPGDAIPEGDMQEIDGAERWRIDSDKCYRFWCISGTDCGRCMAVCPFSHRNNIFHNFVRFLIRHARLFGHFAFHADNLIYGHKPAIKQKANWMKI